MTKNIKAPADSSDVGIHSWRIGLFAAACVGFLIGGCPSQPASEYILGSTGDRASLGSVASVQVVAPVSDLAISGGTPVEVAWRAIATTRIAVIRVIIDVDTDPDNGNEIIAANNIPLTQTNQVVDTSNLAANDYFIGVVIEEIGEIAASDYAPGRITVNQRPQLFFTSPRDNFSLDRTAGTSPRFDVAWTVSDPDSVVTVRILLDPDSTPNGNEVLLRESNSQTGDSFSFNLPTSNFNAGTYRLLALVNDGVASFPFYAPGSIRLRSRMAGVIDLRDLHLPTSPVAGAVFEGFNPRDNAGSLVASAKDIDGDGFADFLMGAQFGKPRYSFNVDRTGVGEAYLVYGRQDRFSGVVNLNSTGTLFRGEIYGGPPEQADPIRPSRGITAFAVMSDWDGDGVREFAFGLPFTDSLSLTAFFGTTDPGFLAPLDPNGYFRSGAVVVSAGSSLRPDIGFPGRNVFNLAEFGTLAHEPLACLRQPAVGQCECIEGFYGTKASSWIAGATWFHRHWADIQGTPNDGSIRLGCRLSSNDYGDQFGEWVSAYDFDGIMMSVPNRDPFVNTFFNNTRNIHIAAGGVVSLYFVSASTGFWPWATTQAPPANTAFNYPGSPNNISENLIPHGGPYHYIVDDLRPFQASQGLTLEGSPGYWVDPDDSPDPCQILYSADICTSARTVRFWSENAGARVSDATAVQDFNADGLQDILIGAPFTNEGRGACYMILGRVRELVIAGELRLEELGLPLNAGTPGSERIFDGIRVIGNPGDRLGQSQDSAGDFNGDGISDVVIGSPLVNNRAGGVAIFFGSRDVINLTQAEIPFNEIPERGLGVILVGDAEGDLTGARVVSAGDVDGDGLDDILIAAPDKSIQMDVDQDGVMEIDRTVCGVVYLVYGSATLRGTINLSQIGTTALPGAMFVGRASGDHLGAGLGEQGDRSRGIAGVGDVDGDGRSDLLLGSVRASPRNRARAGEAYLLYGIGD